MSTIYMKDRSSGKTWEFQGTIAAVDGENVHINCHCHGERLIRNTRNYDISSK